MKTGLLWIAVGAGVAILASCGPDGRFDPDLRGVVAGGLDTAGAARQASPRPTPDARGIISYPDYQVAVARQGDSVAAIAARLGISAQELARHNAIDADAVLEAGALVALPRRLPAPEVTVATPAAAAPAATAATPATAPKPDAPAPRQHVVARGETAWSISRKYGVSIDDLASWNGLPKDMTLRVGQRLLIPVGGASAPGADAEPRVVAPGAGSPTPRPPSASQPLPDEKTAPAAEPQPEPEGQDLGATRTAASVSSRPFTMPVQGAIIRPYEKGKNEGIDISAPPGSVVKAAASGSVAAITRDTDGVPILVLRHQGELLSVYAGLDNLTVGKGDKVSAGQKIGSTTQAGILHFEIRRGFESTDPEPLL